MRQAIKANTIGPDSSDITCKRNGPELRRLPGHPTVLSGHGPARKSVVFVHTRIHPSSWEDHRPGLLSFCAMTERAFENPYPDFNPHQLTGHFDSAGRLTPEYVQRLQNKIWELLQQMEKGLKSSDPGDSTVYTGWAGIALLYLHLFKVFGETSYLHKALEYVSRSLKCLNKQGVTFLCGDAGPLAVGAAVYHKLRQEKEAEDCIRRLLQLHPSAVKMDTRMADELLYGRIGYMYALLFVNRQFEEEKIPTAYIQQVSNTVLASGESLARKRNLNTRSPLMYEWYREYYVGPAHGLSGIYYFLMQPDCGVSQDVLQNIVKPSVDYVNQLKFPSGNFPACIDDTRDLLVHWCHGAPGVIYMLIQAYKLYCDQSYLTSILRCSDVIWQRGLLRKGYGLCHGAAGNAYAFLALYNMTQDVKYLFRACMFADWCIDYGEHGCRTPDTPFSLFEGMAGTIYFLADLLEPKKSKFPAFEL